MSTVQERQTFASRPAVAGKRDADDLSIRAVVYGNQVFHLRKPLTLHFHFEDSLCVCEFEPLHIFAHGKTVQEAFDAFQAEFAACWDGVAQEENSRLTIDARELRQQLSKRVASVQLLS